MINNLSIENFKAFKNISLNLKPLNLLVGLNGMGKSTVIQSLLMLRQSDRIDRGEVVLNGDLVQIGKGADAIYQFAHNDMITICVDFDGNKYEWQIINAADSDILESVQHHSGLVLKEISLFNNNFQYLNAEHIAPQVDYPVSSALVVKNHQIGVNGRFVVHYLNAFGQELVKNEKLIHPKAKSKSLIHQVDAWLGEITPGVKLNTVNVPGTDSVILNYQFETKRSYTNAFRPKNVGFGLSYVLPVIVALLTMEDDKLLILENPESHIHPRGQAELGRLIALAVCSGGQIVIETHSDHIINGIRVAVKDRNIEKDKIGLFYFDRKEDGDELYSVYRSIQIDKNGELSDYPQNFMDEWSNQLLKLL